MGGTGEKSGGSDDLEGSRPDVCVVISHYNAWEADQLLALLDQTRTIPAGVPFHTRVVVNQAFDRTLDLPDRFADVEVLHRPNTGYNIGAWDAGWRTGAVFQRYLFLQEECVILEPNWLLPYLRRLDDESVGLVGESISRRTSWDKERRARYPLSRLVGLSVPPSEQYVDGFFAAAQQRGIDPDVHNEHLQSLILATRREVLESIGGFQSDATEYLDAMYSEMLISKAVTTHGWEICQVGRLPFSVVSHPQWKLPRWAAELNRAVLWRVPTDVKLSTRYVGRALLARLRRVWSRS